MNEQISAGDVLSQTFSVFFRNFATFATICGLLLLPALAYQIYTVQTGYGADPDFAAVWTNFFLGILFWLVLLVLTQMATAALCYGVFRAVRGKPVTISECLSTGFRRLAKVLGVSILAGLITFVGMLMLLIPGIIAAVVLAVAVPAAVIENPGVFDSLRRSSVLTRGYRWIVFGVIFALGLLSWVVQIAVHMTSFLSLWLYVALWWIVYIVYTGLSATASALLYYRLRKAKESIDVDEIAAVFD